MTAPEPPETFAVIGLAASIGGIWALSRVVAAWPADFGAAAVIVQHLAPDRPSLLVEIFARRTPLRVATARVGGRLKPGTIWVAPPGRHVLIDARGRLTLSTAPKVRFLRPAADLLLISLAAAYGDRAVAVILTGSGEDGSAGVRAVRASGGLTIAQDRASSRNWGMPGAAIATGSVDRVLPLEEIGPALTAISPMRNGHES